MLQHQIREKLSLLNLCTVWFCLVLVVVCLFVFFFFVAFIVKVTCKSMQYTRGLIWFDLKKAFVDRLKSDKSVKISKQLIARQCLGHFQKWSYVDLLDCAG